MVASSVWLALVGVHLLHVSQLAGLHILDRLLWQGRYLFVCVEFAVAVVRI